MIPTTAAMHAFDYTADLSSDMEITPQYKRERLPTILRVEFQSPSLTYT